MGAVVVFASKKRCFMSSSVQLQESFLSVLCQNALPSAIFLVNGIKLQGTIETFDDRVILLKNHQGARQMVYKHAISTVAPVHLPPIQEGFGATLQTPKTASAFDIKSGFGKVFDERLLDE